MTKNDKNAMTEEVPNFKAIGELEIPTKEINNLNEMRQIVEMDWQTSEKNIAIAEDSKIKDINTIKELKALKNETMILYKNIYQTYQLYEIKKYSRPVIEYLNKLKRKPVKDWFAELDFKITKTSFFTLDQCLIALDFSREEFDYELANNPIRLFNEFERRRDQSILYTLGRLQDIQTPKEDDLNRIKEQYVIKADEVYNKVISVAYADLRRLSGIATVPEVEQMLKTQQVLEETLYGLMRITILVQASDYAKTYLIRAMSKFLYDVQKQIQKEKSELDDYTELRLEAEKKFNIAAERLKEQTAIINSNESKIKEQDRTIKENLKKIDRIFAGSKSDVMPVSTDIIKKNLPSYEDDEIETSASADDEDTDESDK
jgi:hypothetical protein